jgi:hypothetical protein
MALLDASLSEDFFSSDAGYASTVSMDTVSFRWLTATGPSQPPSTLMAEGANFTYSGTFPTGGTVTSITNFGDNGVADWILSGVSAPLTSLVSTGDYRAGVVRFWETVLGGDDTIIAPVSEGGILFGDFIEVIVAPGSFQPISRIGGDDTFVVNSAPGRGPLIGRGDGPAVVGDALLAAGAEEEINDNPVAFVGRVTGGNDTFTVSGGSHYSIIGDVRGVSGAGRGDRGRRRHQQQRRGLFGLRLRRGALYRRRRGQ